MIKLNSETDKIKLYQSLFMLYKCNQTVNEAWQLYQSNKGSSFLLFHMILELENFNEEYDKYFNCKNIPHYENRINQIRNIVKPVFDEINKWKLRQFRNNIIAHPWRNKGKFVLPDSEKYNVPKKEFEFLLLKNYIWILIAAEFKQELKEAIEHMYLLSKTSKRKREFSSINQVQEDMVKEVNLRCKKFDKDYNLKVQLYDFEN